MWTVAGLAADLAAGRTTSRELLEQSLARIADAAGEGSRAFLKLYVETARAEADLADRLRAKGIVRSPVDGLPVSVKDLFDVGGDVTRAGSKLLADAAPALRDAPPVARLRAAGAPIIGRTNMVEFASARPASTRTTARRATRGTGPPGASPAAPRRAPPWRWPMACAPWRSAAIRGFDPTAGCLVRRDGLQADRAARAARGRLSAFLHPRFDRPAGQYGRLLRGL